MVVDEAVQKWLSPRAENAIKMRENYSEIQIPDLEYEFDISTLKHDLNLINSEKNAITETDETVLELPQYSIASVSTSYNANSAAAYAETYAINNNSLFATYSADCANFVSQCVWAGYIGWNSSMSSATIQNYIANDYKMVIGQGANNWYMGPNQGHSNWIGISSFTSLVTNTSKTYGPNATIFNNNKHYTDLPIILITPGKAIHMGTASSSYDHSAFIYASTGETLSNKLCAAHSSNLKTTVASFAVVYPYKDFLLFLPQILQVKFY